eukprot:TRINITY_DN4583_c0_g1_i1.p1 TRINITY_DN4583_c0_g1~~TRINITY_DN4583_c0_g1_i1.p1  ORF type:complete len:214 (-),score=56.25 TRINITY_DN4583_c0_g1_i1:71-712(-)
MGCGSSTPANSSQSQQPPPAAASTEKQPAAGKAPPAKSEPGFSQSELENLKQRFYQLAGLQKDDGVIDKKEFLSILKFEDSLFTDRIFNLFDVDNSGSITVDEFIKALAVLGPNGPVKEKIKLSFRMWDLNNDTVIAKTELSQLMRSSLEASSLLVSEDQMNKLIDATFGLADCDANGSITLEEYEKLVQMFPNMISNMTLDISGKLGDDKSA